MRILLIADSVLPSTKSVASLINDLALELVAQGHVVTVLAPCASVSCPMQVTVESGVEVVRYRTGTVKGAVLALRAVREMSLSLVAYWRTRHYFREHAFDGIVFYSPSIFFGPLVSVLRKRWGARTYLILRDIFPNWAVDAGLMVKGPTFYLFKAFEHWQYRVADVIGVETSQSKRYFEGGRFSGKVELLRNWTVATQPARVDRNFRKELGLQGKTVFFYGGNIGVAQDMDNLLRLAKNMESEAASHFLIVGEGSERQRITQLAEDERIENVTILPAVDTDTYFSMLSEFDVGLISLDRRLRTFSNTGKILGYMRCGLPILASYNAGNDLGGLLHQSNAGFGSVTGEDELLARNARSLCDSTRRQVMGQNATNLLASEFTVSRITEQLTLALQH